MKLIIDIPEEVLNTIKTFKGKFICENGYDLIQGIKNGTPLDSVKAEMQEKSVQYRGQTYDGLCIALKMLDNIGKAESEDKE